MTTTRTMLLSIILMLSTASAAAIPLEARAYCTGAPTDRPDCTPTNPTSYKTGGPGDLHPGQEPHDSVVIDLVAAAEAKGPWPVELYFHNDKSAVDGSRSSTVPYDYCVAETAFYGDSDDSLPYPSAKSADYCKNLGIANGKIPSRSLESTEEKRTFADKLVNGSPNRWRRGSKLPVCIRRDDSFRVNYRGSIQRASAVLVGATKSAIDKWNAGLRRDLVEFSYVDDCSNAVFRVKAVDGPCVAGAPLASGASPAQQGSEGWHDIEVYAQAFTVEYQNALTAIMAHQLGHGLGLAHESCPEDSGAKWCQPFSGPVPDSIMGRTISSVVLAKGQGPTQNDFDGVNDYYRREGGDNSPENVVLWTPSVGSTVSFPTLPTCQWINGFCV